MKLLSNSTDKSPIFLPFQIILNKIELKIFKSDIKLNNKLGHIQFSFQKLKKKSLNERMKFEFSCGKLTEVFKWTSIELYVYCIYVCN